MGALSVVKEEVYVHDQGKDVVVVIDPTLHGLFPKRSRDAFAELKLSILKNGQDGKCLLCRIDDKWLMLDGHDTLTAVAELRSEGHAVEFLWEEYIPKASDDQDKLLLELMALVIRRKNLQSAVVIKKETKQQAILTYLRQCYNQAWYPNDHLAGENLGCSGTWVGTIRDAAVSKGLLPVVSFYHTSKKGVTRKTKNERTIFKDLTSVNIASSHASVKSDVEIFEEEDKKNVKPNPTIPLPHVTENVDEADVRAQDDEDDEREYVQVLEDWDDDVIPTEEREWFYNGGFLAVESDAVHVLDKDKFVKQLSIRFAPMLKKMGADPIVFEQAISKCFKEPAKKKPQDV